MTTTLIALLVWAVLSIPAMALIGAVLKRIGAEENPHK